VEVLKHFGEDLKGKTVAVSGFGNVAWGICEKVAQLGGKVVTISGPDGYCYDPDGIVTEEKIAYLLEMRASGRDRAQDYADKFGVKFVPKAKVWGEKFDIAMPAAYQNEITMVEAEQMVKNGLQYYIEVANMPTTNEALEYLQKSVKIVAPSKAVNAGGVATSALEMAQNSARYNWEPAEVDAKLHSIMKNIHDASAVAAEECGFGYDLVAGANIAGFKKVAEAMMAQGLI
ncbi:MAG: NADP-specific glutamate dehydrogenase, partial [Clostridia bacterium]|nr:NADP-specific glutamate dehydrogenase [Clostridia bacterium]